MANALCQVFFFVLFCCRGTIRSSCFFSDRCLFRDRRFFTNVHVTTVLVIHTFSAVKIVFETANFVTTFFAVQSQCLYPLNMTERDGVHLLDCYEGHIEFCSRCSYVRSKQMWPMILFMSQDSKNVTKA